MCDDITTLLEHAEVIVVGSPGDDAARALANSRPEQAIVDLTRGSIRPVSTVKTPAESKLVWPAIQPAT
jgi:hypothetical protein